MGLFGKNREENNGTGETVVEPAIKRGQSLDDFLSEDEPMEESYDEVIEDDEIIEELDEEPVEEEIIEDEYHGGDEYEVTEEESESIESFLSSPEEEIIEEEVYEEEPQVFEESEVIEEPSQYYENESDTSSYAPQLEEPEEDSVEVDVNIIEPESDYPEEDEEDIPVIEEEPSRENMIPQGEFVTSDDIDKKFEEFEKRLLEKLMSSMAMMNQVNNTSVQTTQQVKPVESVQSIDPEDVNLAYVDGKLVIDGYKCKGEVVMFTTFDSVRKATWEEVVRRKGHCTYHLTTSGNGGYFIKKSNAPNPYAYIQEKEDAVELAKAYAKREKAELKIHNAKGVIEQSLSYGREKLRG